MQRLKVLSGVLILVALWTGCGDSTGEFEESYASATQRLSAPGLRAEYYDTKNFDQLRSVRTDSTIDFDWGSGVPAGTGLTDPDSFSVRWTGQVRAPVTGLYTFVTRSDDGVRLWVNGQLLVDDWNDHGTTENSGTVSLTGGQNYDIKVEYYDFVAGANVQLLWMHPSQALQVIPQSALLLPPAQALQGLRAEYYDNRDLSGLGSTRTDFTVDYDWGLGAPVAAGLTDAEQFSVRWTGQVRAPVTASYTFNTLSDDGVRLWVNGQLLIDNWTDHGPTENAGVISLTAGQRYDIRLEYYENGGGAVVRLRWSYPGQALQVVPAEALFPPQETACPGADLTWSSASDPNRVCKGPWVYEQLAACTQRYEACACEQFASCPGWDRQPDRNTSTTYTLQNGGCGFVVGTGLVCRPNNTLAASQCESFRQSEVQRLQNEATDDRVLSSSKSYYISAPYTNSSTTHTFTCNVSIQFERNVTRPRPECGCALRQLCHRADASCGPRVQVISSPNLAFSHLAMNPNVPGQVAPGTSGFRLDCSTGEDKPDAVEKFTRLQTYYQQPAVAPVGPQQNDFVERMKRVYELHGDKLLDTQRAAARELYVGFPILQPACGYAPPGTLPACDTQLRGAVILCTRLASSHVPLELLRKDYAVACLSALQRLGDTSRAPLCSSDQPTYLDALTNAHRALHEKFLLDFGQRLAAVGDVAADGTPDFERIPIADTLAVISDWYGSAEAALGAERAKAETDLVVNKFWQVAHGYALGNSGNGPSWIRNGLYAELMGRYNAAKLIPDPAQARTALENAVGISERSGLALDRAVLSAAYSDALRNNAWSPSLSGPPLLRFTSDAVSSLAQRADALAEYHDVGCSVAQCASFTTPTALSQLWKVMAHLDDNGTPLPDGSARPGLSTVLANSSGDLSGWKPAFTKLASGQSRLLAALGSTTGIPAYREELEEFLTKSRTREHAYNTTGLFSTATGDTLHTGVHSEHRLRILDHIDGQNTALTQAKVQLDQQLFNLVGALVNVNDRQASAAQLAANQRRLTAELDTLREQEKAYLAMTAGYGAPGAQGHTADRLLAEWARVGGSSSATTMLRVGAVKELWLSGEDARFSGWKSQTVANVAADYVDTSTFGTDQPQSGGPQVISITTDGAWSPSCSLRDARIIKPEDARQGLEGHPINDTATLIGPEGYSLTWTGSSYSARSAHGSETDRLSIGVRAEACASSPGFVTGNGGRVCGYADASKTWEEGHSWQSGDEGRTSAQFASGLFVDGTPFQAPAGSLLAVEIPNDLPPTRANVKEVHLIRAPQTTIPVRANSRLYFVVNDAACSSQDGTNVLHVTVGRFISSDDAAKGLLQRMAHTLDVFRQRRNELAERHELLPSEIAELERTAKLNQMGVPGEVQIAVDDYPQALKDIFYAYVAKESVLLEASIRLWHIQREIRLRENEFEAAQLTLNNARMSDYLVSLVPQWTTRSLGLDHLRTSARSYAQNYRYFLVPMMDLWYPTARSSLRSSVNASQLAYVDVGTPITALLESLTRLGAETKTAISHANLPYRSVDDSGRPFISLRFPNPAQLDDSCKDVPSARCPRRNMASSYQWATVVQDRELWSSIAAPVAGSPAVRTLRFTVDPADIYSRIGGATGYLPCRAQLPVVRQVGLVLANVSSFEPRHIEGRVLEMSTFVTEGGSKQLRQSNPQWQSLMLVPVLSGEYGGTTPLEPRFRAATQDIRGISPFSTFEFTIRESTLVDWKFNDATTIDLVMVLEYVPTASGNPVSVSACTGQ